jgi:DNA-binding IclR family transcriptional regulator
MHRERTVYLCRTGLASGPAPLVEDWGCPLHRSNCALVILAGRTDEEARKVLSASLAAEAGGKAAKSRLDTLLKQIAAARRDGYSLLVEEGSWNAAFPLVYRGRTFAAALHGPGEPPGSPEKAVLEASLLARRIEEAAREAP